MHPEDLEGRLTDLEVKLSFAEDTLDRLNDIIVRQQQQIDRLVRELVQLRERQPADDPGTSRSLLDELPPHY